MHLLPSRGRPASLQRFFEEGKPEQPGLVIIEEDQFCAYDSVRMPSSWQLIVAPGTRIGYVAAANYGFHYRPDEPWYAIAGDDSIGRTPHWDTLLAEAAVPSKIVWPNDLIAGHCTQPFIGGDLCRALGWFGYPKLGHLYIDTVWGDIQKRLGTGGYMPHIVYEHLHWSVGKSERDTTTRQRKTRGDEQAYRAIDWNAVMEKLKCITPRDAPAVSVGSRWKSLLTWVTSR